MQDLTTEFIRELYDKYRTDLLQVRAEQLALHDQGMRAQLDDIEAEVTYLLLREYRPGTVVEIGALHGWSTTWILRALRDNGVGQLHSYDLVDHARHNVPAELAEGRWTFVHGDVRDGARLPPDIDYLFMDAAHTAGFARWYLSAIMPTLAPGTPVSVHDVFHHAIALPFHEGAVVTRWLRDRGIGYFTASAPRSPDVNRELARHKESLGLVTPIHTGSDNPMIFFNTN
ncbi:class I SAM-dependent methyltransferase [Solihabitans fulvus]|uniref:Class I SAM-dependent methyltransferase n=1 Tax=Solihabitans fulvus TaxID=1892852 RepID=A0A5B2XDY6_9PSEU|nr:class I SAM-dependent methyltransferase [Solihabitans fulvus]KAA2261171.1 class I SAM-dependent methyltransferase [Solihabitans fulvus]